MRDSRPVAIAFEGVSKHFGHAAAVSELSVAIDLYVTETSRHCDFVLPATTMYEREDFPLPFLSLFTTPFIQMTDPVVEPAGEARQEWEIIDQISTKYTGAPYSRGEERIVAVVEPERQTVGIG